MKGSFLLYFVVMAYAQSGVQSALRFNSRAAAADMVSSAAMTITWSAVAQGCPSGAFVVSGALVVSGILVVSGAFVVSRGAVVSAAG